MENNSQRQTESAFYQNKDTHGFSGYISEDNLFLILAIDDGITHEEGQTILQSLRTNILSSVFDNLFQFELKLSEIVTENNLPTNFSLAVGYRKNDILYLKTGGTGNILIYRKKHLAKIISGEKTASGYGENNDLFIFTTDKFIEAAGGENGLHKEMGNKSPREISERITLKLQKRNVGNTITLFVKFKPEETTRPVINTPNVFSEKLQSAYLFLQGRQAGAPQKKRTFTFIVVGIIFLIFMWSVVFGYKRRQNAIIQSRVTAAKAQISQKLSQADDASYLSIPRAIALIDEAKANVDDLRKEIGNRPEVTAIDKMINDEENKILKVQEKPADEFFDLTVDNPQAKGTKLYLDNDNVVILDSGQKTVYIFSLTKKSLNKYTFNELQNAQLIASDQGNPLFYVEGDGIYKINNQGKLAKVVDNDPDWGNISAMTTYNGNLYLLDPLKDSIDKYVGTDSGYATRSAYFQGGENGLAGANSLAIDASVYVGFSDHIFKFTSGSQDSFKTEFPNPSINIQKIFTDKNTEKVYSWDKNRGSVYILGKDGTYEQEINSSVLKQASDFIVYDNAAYILSGAKIYKMSMN